MKKSLMLLGIFLINFVSAASLSDFFYRVDSRTVILIAAFLICFAIINMALSKFFRKEDRTTGTVIAAVIAFLAAYGINQTTFYTNINLYWLDDLIWKAQEIGFIGTAIILGVTIYFIYLLLVPSKRHPRKRKEE